MTRNLRIFERPVARWLAVLLIAPLYLCGCYSTSRSRVVDAARDGTSTQQGPCCISEPIHDLFAASVRLPPQ